MKTYLFICMRTALLLIGMGFCTSIHAQYIAQDSAESTMACPPRETHRHSLHPAEIIFPAAVISLSAFSIHNNWLKKQHGYLQETLSANGRHHFKADEYLRFSQMAAAYALELCGVKGRHNALDKSIILAMSAATMGIAVKSLKSIFKEDRPDGNGRDAFPSGHTATAFMGAEFLYQEYKDVSPWIGYTGYALATATGYLRIYNNRHYINDVLAGACIGMLSTKFAYWLYPRCFRNSACGRSALKVAALPYYSKDSVGANLCLRF